MSANCTSRLRSVTGRWCSSSNRASSRAVKDRRAHDTFATQRLGASRYSAETYVEVLVAPVQGAMVWSSPPRGGGGTPPDPVVRGEVVGMALADIHVPGVHTASLRTCFGDEHRFRPTRPTRGARGVPLFRHPPYVTPSATGSPGLCLALRDIVDELTSCEVELSLGGWLSPGSAHGRSPERDPLPSARPMDRCENRHAGAGGSGRGEPELCPPFEDTA
jgi:hypothetical protein